MMDKISDATGQNNLEIELQSSISRCKSAKRERSFDASQKGSFRAEGKVASR